MADLILSELERRLLGPLPVARFRHPDDFCERLLLGRGHFTLAGRHLHALLDPCQSGWVFRVACGVKQLYQAQRILAGYGRVLSATRPPDH